MTTADQLRLDEIRGGPPRDDEGRATASPTDVKVDNHTNATEFTVGLRRRRAASYRVPRLDCGIHADPWPCRCYDAPQSPERNADGYHAAAQHLLAAGLLPAPNIPAMRLMWRRGAEQRRLSQLIAERWEVAA